METDVACEENNDVTEETSSDPDAATSRLLRQQYRAVSDAARECEANPYATDPSHLQELISRQNDLFHVKSECTLVATYDSETLLNTTNAARRVAQSFQPSLSKFDPVDFGSKLKLWIASRDSADADNNSDEDVDEEDGDSDADSADSEFDPMNQDPGPSTSAAGCGRQHKASSGGRMTSSSTAASRRKLKPLNCDRWVDAGREVEKFFRRPPVFKFLYGSLDFDTVPVAKVKKERQKAASQDIAPVAKLKEMDLNVQTNDGKTSRHVEHILRLLRRKYKTTNRQPFDFWEFALDPSSFSKTVENLFHISFLFKEREARVFRTTDEDQTLWIEPLGSKTQDQQPLSHSNDQQQRATLSVQNNDVIIPPTDGSPAGQSNPTAGQLANQQRAGGNQSILSINMEQWKELLDLYELAGHEPMISQLPSGDKVKTSKKRKRDRELAPVLEENRE